MRERDIQKQILHYLALKGIWHVRQNTGAMLLGGPGVGKRRMVRFGKPGQPDIYCRTPNGHTVWIEVKSPTGRQTPEQKAWQNDVEDFGDTYILARDLDDVRVFFEMRRAS